MKRITTLFFCTFFFSAASAVANTGWSIAYKVGVIEVGDTGIFFGHLEGDVFQGAEGCENAAWVFFDNGTEMGNRALALGLAAQAADRKVKFYSTGCYGSYIKAERIQILP